MHAVLQNEALILEYPKPLFSIMICTHLLPMLTKIIKAFVQLFAGNHLEFHNS